MTFLTAEWRKLAFANFEVDPDRMRPHVPFGTELDLWQDRCFASLIGFRFVETRLKGIKIPFHVNFEEVNLRFYVKRKDGDHWKRGVVFIREVVPKPAIAWVANTLYNERYKALPMRYAWTYPPGEIQVKYSWKTKGSWQSMQVRALAEPQPLKAGSETAFITEHYWGYSQSGKNKTTEYQVTHPSWQIYEATDYGLKVDFSTYGKAFEFLNGQEPSSVMLAEGSPITIESKQVIRG